MVIVALVLARWSARQRHHWAGRAADPRREADDSYAAVGGEDAVAGSQFAEAPAGGVGAGCGIGSVVCYDFVARDGGEDAALDELAVRWTIDVY